MHFTCPYCNKPTTITNPNHFTNWTYIDIAESISGKIGLRLLAITCPNEECKKLWLKVQLKMASKYNDEIPSGLLQEWQLLPESEAKVLPDYIPRPIQEDYYEACRIRDLSSKASATLSCRCLQGMIRDFWKISKSRLKDEVDELENRVDSITWEAIDSVRSVGNIGAHMEKDIDIIIDVEPKEAQLLIELIEQLISDWYIQRHDREERMKKVKQIAESKDLKKVGD